MPAGLFASPQGSQWPDSRAAPMIPPRSPTGGALPPGALGGLSQAASLHQEGALRLGEALEGQAGQTAGPRVQDDL